MKAEMEELARDIEAALDGISEDDNGKSAKSRIAASMEMIKLKHPKIDGFRLLGFPCDEGCINKYGVSVAVNVGIFLMRVSLRPASTEAPE